MFENFGMIAQSRATVFPAISGPAAALICGTRCTCASAHDPDADGLTDRVGAALEKAWPAGTDGEVGPKAGTVKRMTVSPC